jgi:hypothetical protein
MKIKLTALTAAVALGLAVPGTSVADRGGVPHSAKPCPSKIGKGHARGHQRHAARNGHGKKCGRQPRS